MAEHLNNHFCNIAKTIETEIPPCKQFFQDYLKQSNKKYFIHKSLNQKENTTRNKITQKQQAIGPQSIPTKLFKTFNKALSKPLTNLINLSFVKGVFPNALNTAHYYQLSKKVTKQKRIIIGLSH